MWDAGGGEGGDTLATHSTGPATQVTLFTLCTSPPLHLPSGESLYLHLCLQVVGLNWTDTNTLVVTAVEAPPDL